MDTKKLRDMWNAPENSRLTRAQFSVRLPLDVAAKLMALEELYPGRNRTQLISDLLSAALNDVEAQLPCHASIYKSVTLGDPEDLWTMGGERDYFHSLANKYHKILHRDGEKSLRFGTLYPQEVWREDEIPPEVPR